MKNLIRHALIAILFACAFNSVIKAQGRAEEPVPALEGLDPVMLVEGKEVQGDLKISLVRGSLQYFFAGVENKARFEKDPSRYEIQLDGHCARMGAPTGANPDLFTVHDGKIYIFGSAECKKLFEAAPHDYLETPGPPSPFLTATDEALKRGKQILDRAAGAVGGSDSIDNLNNYVEKSSVKSYNGAHETKLQSTMSMLFPDRFRREDDRGNGRLVAFILSRGEAFFASGNRFFPMRDDGRDDLGRQFNRHPLLLLRLRKSNGFKAIRIETAEKGLDRVAIDVDGIIHTLSFEESSGRLTGLSYRGRGDQGVFGEIVYRFSDFKTVGGLTLPHRTEISVKGRPMRSINVESITVNGDLPAAIFEKPGKK